jgi:hypothetical protein
MVIHRSQEDVPIVWQDQTSLPALDSSSKRSAQTRVTRRDRPCDRIEPDDCGTTSRVLHDQDVCLSLHGHDSGSENYFFFFFRDAVGFLDVFAAGLRLAAMSSPC